VTAAALIAVGVIALHARVPLLGGVLGPDHGDGVPDAPACHAGPP
jgi:hypothetical protein